MKAGYSKARDERAKQADAEHEPGSVKRCAAFGCPLFGSVDPGNAGKYFCRLHAFNPPDRWQGLTRAIREHAWFTAHIVDMQSDARLKDWREQAEFFWRDADRSMIPAQFETRAAYLYRLHLEFEYRVGARSSRPAAVERKQSVRRGDVSPVGGIGAATAVNAAAGFGDLA